jgi:hypothetical protein
MRNLYRVTIHGMTLESCNLKQLLARAVSEKRNMDRRLRFLPAVQPPMLSAFSGVMLPARAGQGRRQAV